MLNPVIQIELFSAEDQKSILKAGYSADYPIISASWSVQHGTDTSQCEIQLPGDDLALNDLVLNLKPYNPQPPATPGGATTGPSDPGGNPANAKDRLTQEKLIIEECKRQGVTNPKQIAYILATAQHEADQFQTMREYHDGSDYEGDPVLGNTQPGDGKRFRGRGYVQITGRGNYEKYSKITGKDLIGKPELAEDQQTARFILVNGMKNGTFTGVGLSEYTSSNGDVDYHNARRTVNGTDKADKIAGYARTYEQRLASGDLKDGAPTPAPNPTPPTQGKTEPVAIAHVTPPSVPAGGHLIIRWGEFGGLIYEALYLLSNARLEVKAESGGTLTLSGISASWSVNQYKLTGTKINITLKQLADEVARSRGLTLEFKGEGTNILQLENKGLTQYQLLLRECARAGYTCYCEGTLLRCFPIAPTANPQGEIEHLIQISDILSLSIESKPGGATPGNTGGITGAWDRDSTIKGLAGSGTIQQEKPPIRSGMVDPVAVENKPKDPLKSDAKTTGEVKVEGKDGEVKVLTESAMKAEVSRVMDLPVKIDLAPNMSYQSIRPGNILNIPTAIIYSSVLSDTRFWVAGVHWHYSQGKLGQSIDAYKPGAEVPVAQAMSGGNGAGNTGPITPSAGWKHPYPGSIMTAPWGQPRGDRRHGGQDFSTGTNSPIYAAASGIVTDHQSGCRVGDTSCGGGYGNLIDIVSEVGGKRYLHRYAHNTSISVKTGDRVQQGQQIAISGNTGFSFGEHLHFEIRSPDTLYGFGGTIDPAQFGIK